MARSMSSRTSRRLDGHRKSWPTRSLRTQVSLPCPAPHSAISGRDIFASAWRTRSRTSRKHSIASTPGRRKISKELRKAGIDSDWKRFPAFLIQIRARTGERLQQRPGLSDAEAANVIKNGKGKMKSYKDKLSDADVKALVA